MKDEQSEVTKKGNWGGFFSNFSRFKWKDLKIGWKYGLTVTLIIILIIISTTIVSTLLTGIKDDVEMVEQSSDRSVNVTEMGSLTRSKNNRVISYMLNTSHAYLQEYEERREEFNTLEAELKEQMDTPELQNLFNQIVENDKEMNALFLDEIVPAIQAGESNITRLRLQVDQLSSETVTLLEGLRERVDEERQIAVNAANESANYAYLVQLISIISAIVGGGLLIFFTNRLISRNLTKVVEVSNQIAGGDLTVEKIDYDGKDEVGQLAASINRMGDSLRGMIAQISEISKTVKIQSDKLSQSSNEVTSGAQQIAATMQELSAGSEEQASSSIEITNLMSTLNEKINSASDKGNTLRNLSDNVLQLSNNGKEQIERSVVKMNEINELVLSSVEQVKGLDNQSQEISKLVVVIQGIAEQTNLLALNAAIEAARAGEAGRGFAVVANEVRKLAEQVRTSITEITNIINGVQKETKKTVDSLHAGYQKVEEGNEQMGISRQSFDSITEGVSEMIEGIQTVSANLVDIRKSGDRVKGSSEEIAAASEQAAAGIEQSSATAQQQSSSMQEITNNTSAVAALAEELNEMVQRFKI